MTNRELIYMILDQARMVTDDISLNEEHVLFLANRARAALLTQKYKTMKLEVLDANYQVLCIGLTENRVGSECAGDSVLVSKVKVPNRLNIGNDLVTPYNYLKGTNISLIPIERMRYVGFNKFLKNIIYAAIGHDGYLYMKSLNPMFKYMQNAKITAVFEDAIAASELECYNTCEVWDRTFPIEDTLVSSMIERVVKETVGAAYRPKDDRNNANDDSDKALVTNSNNK